MRTTPFRAFLLALALVTAAFAQAQTPDAPKPGRIEGTVVSTLGAAVPRATVRLSETGAVDYGGLMYAPSITSGEDGHFVFENVPSGKEYRLQADRAGFLPGVYTANPNTYQTGILVKVGATVGGLKIVLTPKGVLTGTVVDDRGDPVQFAQVVAVEKQTPPSFSPNAYSRGTTDDRGMFRIPNLSPGAYYVRAEMDRAQQASGVMTVPTFHPSSTTLDAAAAIDIAGGVENPISIHLRRERVFTIRGKIVGLASGDQPGFTPISVNSSQYAGRTISVGKDGAFVIPQLLPGRYILDLESSRFGGGNGGYARTEVTITDKDVTDIVMEYRLLPQITGKVIAIDGGRADVFLFRPIGGSSDDSIQVIVPLNGSFELRARPGAYAVMLQQPGGNYVRKIQLNGTEVKGAIEFPPTDGSELTITVSPHTAQLTVVVRDREGKPVAGAAVWARPRILDDRFLNHGVVNTRITDLQGKTEMSIPPGEYYILLPDPKHKEQSDALWRRLTDPNTPVPGDRTEVKLAEDSQTEIVLTADLP